MTTKTRGTLVGLLAGALLAWVAVAWGQASPGSRGMNNPPRFTPRRFGVSEFSGPVAIISSGRLGLAKAGTYDGLTANLHIVGASAGSTTSGNPSLVLEGHSTTATLGPVLACRRAHDEGGAIATVATGDILCTQTFGGYGGSPASWRGAAAVGAGAEGGAAFETAATENWNGASFGAQLGIYTVKTGGSALTQRILMDGGGATRVFNIPGSEVFAVESEATNDDPRTSVYHSRATAAANGTTNIDFNLTSTAPTRVPCDAGKGCIVEARTICHCTSGSNCNGGGAEASAGNYSMMVVKNNGGTITLQGAVVTPMASQIGSTTVTSLTLSVSSPNARMAVVVPTNNNHTCHVRWDVTPVGT